MSHYDEQREKEIMSRCPISDQVADYCNADDNARTCPDCREVLDEVYDGSNYTYECPYCECEVEIDEE